MVSLEELVKKLEIAYDEEKKKECEELYNAIHDIFTSRGASVQNILFVIEMVRWGLLRAYYLDYIEGAVKIPLGAVPLMKIQTDEKIETEES